MTQKSTLSGDMHPHKQVHKKKSWTWICGECGKVYFKKSAAEHCYNNHFPLCSLCREDMRDRLRYSIGLHIADYSNGGSGSSFGHDINSLCINCKEEVENNLRLVLSKYQKKIQKNKNRS